MKTKRMVTALAAAAALCAAAPAVALADAAAGIVNFNQGASERLEFSVIETGAGEGGSIIYKNLTAGFSYSARVYCVDIGEDTATFSYVIPSRPQVPSNIWGLHITFTVVDDAPDEIGYAVAPDCAPASTNPITGGNLTVSGSGGGGNEA